MALDDIQVTSPSQGTVPVSGAAETAALATGLQVTKKIADEAVVGSLVGDLRDAEMDAMDAATQSTPDVLSGGPADVLVDPSGLTSEEATRTYQNIQRLLGAADQAQTSSHRNRAILEMQRALSSAKNKFPWAAQQLDAAAGRYMSNNPGLAQLAAIDTATTAQGAVDRVRAEKDLEDIKAYAYDELGMDPAAYPFGSKDFANKYGERTRIEQGSVVHEQKVRAVQSEANASAIDKGALWQEELTGEYGEVNRFYLSKQDLILGHAKEVARLTELGDTAGLVEMENEWNTIVMPSLIREMAEGKIAINREYAKMFPGAEAQSPSGVTARQQADQAIEDFTIYQEALSAGVQEVGEIIKTHSAIRTQRRLDSAPSVRATLDLLSQPGASNMISLWDQFDFNYSSPAVKALIAKGYTNELPTMLTAQIRLDAETDQSADSSTRKRNRATQRANGISPTGVLVSADPDVNIAAAQADYEMHVRQAQDPAALNGDSGATVASNSLNGMANDLEVLTLNTVGDFDEIVDPMWESLASDNLRNLVDAAGGETSAAYVDFRNVVQDEYLKEGYGPDSLNARMSEIYRTAGAVSVPGTSDRDPLDLLSVVEIDDSRLAEDGVITFNVIGEKVEELWPETTSVTDRSFILSGAEQTANIFGLGDKVKEANAAIDRVVAPVTGALAQEDATKRVRELEALAAKLSTDVTNYIRVNSFLNLAQTKGEDDFELAAEKSGIQALIGRTIQ